MKTKLEKGADGELTCACCKELNKGAKKGEAQGGWEKGRKQFMEEKD